MKGNGIGRQVRGQRKVRVQGGRQGYSGAKGLGSEAPRREVRKDMPEDERRRKTKDVCR